MNTKPLGYGALLLALVLASPTEVLVSLAVGGALAIVSICGRFFSTHTTRLPLTHSPSALHTTTTQAAVFLVSKPQSKQERAAAAGAQRASGELKQVWHKWWLSPQQQLGSKRTQTHIPKLHLHAVCACEKQPAGLHTHKRLLAHTNMLAHTHTHSPDLQQPQSQQQHPLPQSQHQ